jgi:electron transfer flavoprotein beta subunit
MTATPAPDASATAEGRTGASGGAPDGPLVVACLRISDLRPTVDPLAGTVTRDRLGVGLSPADAAALEHALRFADAWSGRVVAVCVGPESVEPVLRDVAALGAAVVRVPLGDEGDGHRYVSELVEDERGLARTLVAALAPFGPPDLVVCGDRSVDRGTGALPAFLAHELGAAQALGLVALAPVASVPATGDSGRWTLHAERRLDAGWRERLLVALPAVCSVEGAGTRLRRASLAGTLAAERGPVPVDRSLAVAAASAPGDFRVGAPRPFRPRTRVLPAPRDDDPRLRLLTLTGALVAHDPPTVVQPADAAEAADVLLAFLVRHGYLDAGSDTPGDVDP